MRESNFASEIKQASYNFDCFYYKIPDISQAQRFIPSKPFDAFVLYKGKYHAMEYKMHKRHTAWSFKEVKDHQIQGLMDVVEKGKGMGWVVVNIRYKGMNRTFAKSVYNFVLQKSLYENEYDKKSIPIKELMITWKEITRKSRNKDGKLCWDLEEFLIDSPY